MKNGDIKQKTSTKKVVAFEGRRPGAGGAKTAPQLNLSSASDGGGDPEQKAVAKRMVKGMKNGVGSADKQNPREQRARKIEAWCDGAKDYK